MLSDLFFIRKNKRIAAAVLLGNIEVFVENRMQGQPRMVWDALRRALGGLESLGRALGSLI